MNAITQNPRAVPGNNRPPVVDFYREANEGLPDYLQADNADLVARTHALDEAFTRAPVEVHDDETCGKMSDFVKQISAQLKALESKRTGDKEPTLQAGRIIDGFYKSLAKPMETAKDAINGRITLYLRKKEAEERRRREETERLAREEAERKAAAAREAEAKAKTEADLQQAIAAEQDATIAQVEAVSASAAAAAKPAELSRTRGDLGAVASLRSEWVSEVEDRAILDLEPLRHHFTPDALDKALRAAVKAGAREIKGARIYQRQVAAVR